LTVFKSFIATSLDGFIARPDGSIDWLTDGWADIGHDHGHAAFMGGVDAIIMGRGTFDTVAGFDAWPYSKPSLVMSRTLRQDAVPAKAAGKVEITSATPRDVADECIRHGWQEVYVDGGQILGAFIALNLLDELTVTRLPILIGAGRPLFGALAGDLKLKTVANTAFANGFVQTTYRFPGR
jgi:dihydrofolate reductase